MESAKKLELTHTYRANDQLLIFTISGLDVPCMGIDGRQLCHDHPFQCRHVRIFINIYEIDLSVLSYCPLSADIQIQINL